MEELYPLSYLKGREKDASEFFFGYLDSSDNIYPGWTLRNYLYMIAYVYKLNDLEVIAFRCNFESGDHMDTSKIYHIILPNIHKDFIPPIIGWNTTSQNKIYPKLVDLSKVLDETFIAQEAVNLNLKLMRWRHIPSFDIDKISKIKCLLIGAGTLGSHVAHNLIAWGVRNIDFVDNGTVSYSNLTRQTLYSFDDLNKKKAETASLRLKQIFPGIQSSAFDIDIPMPGHPVNSAESSQVIHNIINLNERINEADVVFILLDSRESRWLPTLLCAVNKILCYDVAIGFSTYLCIRHGLVCPENETGTVNEGTENETGNEETDNPDSSCYFCSDLASPSDSLTDATIDMKCAH